MGDEYKNCEKNQQGNLSDDLIFQEIVTKLPIKSILRFKSVSKQWYSILSCSKFVINTLFIKSGKDYYLFSYINDQICANFQDNLVKLDPNFGFEKDDDLQLTGSCNGLVCLTQTCGKYFILWNPATRKMQKYESDIPLEGIVADEAKKVGDVSCGFWYASSVDDYKYVQLMKPIPGTKCIAHVFSLREKKCKRFIVDFGNDFIVSTPNAMLTNEMLYWPAYCGSGFYFIISFNLEVERLDVIMLEDRECLGVMGGCLSKCDSDSGGNTADVLMHIFESTGVILKSFRSNLRLKLGKPSQMIEVNKTGKFFVTGPFNCQINDSDSRMLGIIDTSTKPMQYTTLLSFTDKIDIARYVPSPVSPIPFEES